MYALHLLCRFTYNAVINALAKSCEAGAAARAERVLQNMVNRHRNGGGDDVKPTTINFNTVLDAVRQWTRCRLVFRLNSQF